LSEKNAEKKIRLEDGEKEGGKEKGRKKAG
jgi:hypothetical protein